MEAESIIPDELRFAITRKCDGACRHCYNQSGKDMDRLSSNDFIQIIKEVHAVNPNMDRITLTGGEPLNETDKVLKISRFAKSLGIRVRLVTRGWELNGDVCIELKEAGVSRVQIGLDSSGDFGYEDEFQVKWDTFHSWLRGDKLGFTKFITEHPPLQWWSCLRFRAPNIRLAQHESAFSCPSELGQLLQHRQFPASTCKQYCLK